MAGAGSAAIILVAMHLDQAWTDLPDSISHGILFDIHVESIQHDLASWMIHPIDQLDGLIGCCNEAGLKPVEGFQPQQSRPACSAYSARSFRISDQDLHIVFALFSRLLPGSPYGGIKWSNHILSRRQPPDHQYWLSNSQHRFGAPWDQDRSNPDPDSWQRRN